MNLLGYAAGKNAHLYPEIEIIGQGIFFITCLLPQSY